MDIGLRTAERWKNESKSSLCEITFQSIFLNWENYYRWYSRFDSVSYDIRKEQNETEMKIKQHEKVQILEMKKLFQIEMVALLWGNLERVGVPGKNTHGLIRFINIRSWLVLTISVTHYNCF